MAQLVDQRNKKKNESNRNIRWYGLWISKARKSTQTKRTITQHGLWINKARTKETLDGIRRKQTKTLYSMGCGLAKLEKKRVKRNIKWHDQWISKARKKIDGVVCGLAKLEERNKKNHLIAWPVDQQIQRKK